MSKYPAHLTRSARIGPLAEGLIDLLKRYLIAYTKISEDAFIGDKKIKVNNSIRFRAGEQIILFDDNSIFDNDSGERIGVEFNEVAIDATETEEIVLKNKLKNDWLLENNARLQKVIANSVLEPGDIYYGDREAITFNEVAVCVEPESKSSEWMALGGLAGYEYRIGILVYVKAAGSGDPRDEDRAARVCHLYADAIEDLLIRNIHVDVTVSEVPIIENVFAGQDYVIIPLRNAGDWPPDFCGRYEVQDNFNAFQRIALLDCYPSSSSSSSSSSSHQVSGTYFIDFESSEKHTYLPETLLVNDVWWDFERSLIGSGVNDKKDGLRSLRMSPIFGEPAFFETSNNKTDGIGTVSFYLSVYGFDFWHSMPLRVQYSQDNGASWNDIMVISPPFPTILTHFSETINLQGSVKIRFFVESDFPLNARRINIDNIQITGQDDWLSSSSSSSSSQSSSSSSTHLMTTSSSSSSISSSSSSSSTSETSSSSSLSSTGISSSSSSSSIGGEGHMICISHPSPYDFNVSDFAVLRRKERYMYDSRVDNVEYGTVAKGSYLLKASKLSWFGKETRVISFPQIGLGGEF